MNKHVFDLLTGVIGLGLMFAVPVGILLAHHLDNSTWLLMSIISFIILASAR
jgi:hypothetical protein